MTEPEQQPVLVENMLLLRKEDFDDLLDRAAERGAERCLAHLGLENGHGLADDRPSRWPPPASSWPRCWSVPPSS